MALSADLSTTLHGDKDYANLPTMGSSSEDEEDEHFVLPNQLRLRSNYNEKKYEQFCVVGLLRFTVYYYDRD